MVKDLNFPGIEFKEVRGLNKYLGLMFKVNSKPLIFNFVHPINYSIHSYFCKTFIAYWYLDNQLIDKQIIIPFQTKIKPKSNYNKLIEIPIKK